MSNIKFYAVAALLAVAAYVALSSYLPERFDTGPAARMADFPGTVGAWKGEDMPLTKRDYAILETDNLIMRTYKDPAGREVVLYIIYSDNNRKVMHPPEVCYIGGGQTVTEKRFLSLTPAIRATRMITETAKGERQFVVYWFRAGELNIAEYLEQQFRIALRRTFGKKTSGAMIRISADVKEGEEDVTAKTIREFAALIEPLLNKYVP